MSAQVPSPRPDSTIQALARWKLREVRVDWITCTAPQGQIATLIMDMAAMEQNNHVAAGDRRKPWQWRSYVGEMTAEIAYGWRRDGAIVRCSGDSAHLLCPLLVQSGARVTRIDLAVTAQADRDVEAYAETLYDALVIGNETNRHPNHLSLIRTNGSGQTLYVGQRAADVYLRLYDKWRESGYTYPAHSWRWEVEYKHRVASHVANAVATDSDRQGTITAIVASEYDRRGIRPPWEPYSRRVPTSVGDRERDAERCYRWLRETVAPALDWLQYYYSYGDLVRQLGIHSVLAKADE